jgi:chaperonin GroES
MKWQPHGDQILVRPLLPAEQTSSGLVIPDEARDRPQRGVVLAVGPGQPNELNGALRPMQAEAGQLVLFGAYAGMAEELDGEKVLIMRDQEVLVSRTDYTLTEHLDVRGRKVYHEASEVCDLCPKVDLSDERARILRERALHETKLGEGAATNGRRKFGE